MNHQEKELRVKEYEQAGEACRNHDSLIRTGITIFGAAQAAIFAIIVGQSEPNPCYTYFLEVLGFWLSFVVWITTFRLGRRYATYMKRAKDIEKELGFSLYSASQEEFKSTWYLRCMPGNKMSMASLPILMAVIYGFLVIENFEQFIEAIGSGACML